MSEPVAGFSRELIEESRRRLGIPDDWTASACANDCGDIVWTPPGVVDAQRVCSAACLVEFLYKQEPQSGR